MSISGSQFLFLRERTCRKCDVNGVVRRKETLPTIRSREQKLPRLSKRHCSRATMTITEENVDPKTAQGILRHASCDITMDIYTHAQDEAKRKALEKYGSRLVH